MSSGSSFIGALHCVAARRIRPVASQVDRGVTIEQGPEVIVIASGAVHVEVSLDRDDDRLNSNDGGIARADAPPHFEVTRRTPSVRCGQGPATSATATMDGYLYRLERPGGSISRLAAITAMVAIRHPVLLGSPVSRSCARDSPVESPAAIARLD
jgi:hypothetical protein